MSVPDVGLTEALNRIFGLVVNTTPYVAVGSGTNAESASDTSLQAESVRVLASTVSVSGNVATIKGFLNTSQGNVAISETGLLTLATVGVLIDRSIETPAQTKTSAQEAIVEYVITLERV